MSMVASEPGARRRRSRRRRNLQLSLTRHVGDHLRGRLSSDGLGAVPNRARRSSFALEAQRGLHATIGPENDESLVEACAAIKRSCQQVASKSLINDRSLRCGNYHIDCRIRSSINTGIAVASPKVESASADGDVSAAEGADRGIDRRIELGIVGAKSLRQAIAAIGAAMLPRVDRARVHREMVVKAGHHPAVAFGASP